MTWELFERPQTGNTEIKVMIYKSGVLRLSQAAFDALNSPAAVVLLFDNKEQVIGLKPAPRSDPHAFWVASPTSSPTIGIVSFCKHYQIPYDTSKQYEAKMEDGMLVVSLSTGKATKRLRDYPKKPLK